MHYSVIILFAVSIITNTQLLLFPAMLLSMMLQPSMRTTPLRHLFVRIAQLCVHAIQGVVPSLTGSYPNRIFSPFPHPRLPHTDATAILVIFKVSAQLSEFGPGGSPTVVNSIKGCM
ncbi:hypothetical protein K491DRAFT_144279 [Lophiostoma macrostomum CBS 122681]|uniref:Uncharacterized protein n=1 Tax=Lophiostoma macrostomum CBS 122681 TaxID=1314788 RepID=A0A6A6ST53_9PLEO|nr:hypothetical protein K491DRAFT_144279 [Lophiostoma macrostomum CBS 122681]